MKGRDFGHNDSYKSFDRESFDPTFFGVLSRTLNANATEGLGPSNSESITKFMRSYLGPERFNFHFV